MLVGIYAESGTRRYILNFNMIMRPNICRIETKLGMVLLTSEHIHVCCDSDCTWVLLVFCLFGDELLRNMYMQYEYSLFLDMISAKALM